MELNFSREWRIIETRDAAEGGPASFAAEELASVIGRCGGCRKPVKGDESADSYLFVLDAGRGDRAGAPGGRRKVPRFSWRASPDRVELYGEDGHSLLRSVYDFLEALGARWPEPGEDGERLPEGPLLSLAMSSSASSEEAFPLTLILGHAVFLEDWEARLAWAARVGYSTVFIHTTPDALALGAVPASLYEVLRPEIAQAARRLGLCLEEGGHGLSSLLPRSLFKVEPRLFREKDGKRGADGNFCPSSEKALSLIGEALAARAAAHPEISVFHFWPDDLPGGGWCSCPSCVSLSPAAQSLKAAKALASDLATSRPDAALSFLAYHDTGDLGAVDLGELPANLELLWAPRLRSWGSALGDAASTLNAASLAAFRRTAKAWREAGGGRVAVFEYYEDALLFKGAVPPLAAVIEGDLAAYRGGEAGEAADAIGVLCTGGRLPLAPRPNLALLPRLASAPGRVSADAALADWAAAAYGSASAPMLEYWRELEAAWAIDLDIREADTGIHMHIPENFARSAADPPADWGDPWKADARRLEEKRGRCEELFDHLRAAEARLTALSTAEGETSRQARAALREADEYAISDAVLELNCARLAAYHELAAGDARAAADIANLALSASSAVRKALRRLPGRRSRREMDFLVYYFYDLKLRAIRRANARSGLRRLIDLWYSAGRASLAAAGISGVYKRSTRDRNLACARRRC